MINVLALALLVSSLAAAGVWSPLPDPSPSPADRTVVREGHRVIVVEQYERRVPASETPLTTQNLLEEAKDKFHEATSHLPNLGQGISTPDATTDNDRVEPTHSAKEVICDAYGSCKEKLSNIREQVSGEASHLKQRLVDDASRAKEKTEDAIKETVQGGKDVVGNLSSAAEKAVEHAEEMAGEAMRGGNLSDVLRRAKDVAGERARAAGSVAQLVGFAVAYGTGFWVTFVSSHVLATALPRQQFGTVQSKVYPVYFRAMAYGVGLAAVAQWLGAQAGRKEERAQGYNLVAALGLVLVNLLYLEPRATKVMFERMKMEKEEGRGRDMADVIVEPVMTASTATTATTTPTKTRTTTTTTYGGRAATSAADQEAIKGRAVKLNKRLKKLNTYSSVLNILSLMGLTWHLVHLAGKMQVTC